MRIAHSQFGKIAPTLSFRQIVDLAITSQRYATNRVLIPFLSRWTAPFRQKILQPRKEEWLFVAYQFGYEEDYRRLAKYMAVNCRVDRHGNLLSADGKVVQGKFPDGAIRKFSPLSPSQILQRLLPSTRYSQPKRPEG
jgi:hypothetical protein